MAERQPTSDHARLMKTVKPEYAEQYERRLIDFGEYRLTEMDDAGIDVQVLSLTAPGLQVDIDAERTRDNARFANNLNCLGAQAPDFSPG